MIVVIFPEGQTDWNDVIHAYELIYRYISGFQNESDFVRKYWYS
ncbi:hypothetical protein B6N60_01048 [Richelia sinica FACHB-800]|uniref:Uncharacterized protein n=1 Tax=Richelia sinica FACHB-800 TaxID=1357546 RepID=A0A975Y3Q0_9NOST|nr:hypothetical protein B6N60_01048 [Richelia sinica FACHB-800]